VPSTLDRQAPGGSPRHCLVTGGAGFIGSHLTERLLSRGDTVTVVDNLSTGRKINLDPAFASANGRLRFIEADLADALGALGKGERFDEIYHLAAAVGVRLVVEDPIRSIETNVDQAAAILRFAQSHPSPSGGPPTVLIASSSEVYGKSTRAVFSEEDDVVYGPTTVARWSYAFSKAIDEFLALAYHQQRGLPAVVVRFFNTVGPRQIGDYGMVLPRFVIAALKGQSLEVHGDGRQSRCFCDVRDVVGVLPTLVGNPLCRGRVFNVGSDAPISIAELADLVIRTLGSRSEIRMVPYTDVYGSGFEDLRQRRPDLSRIREAVGFTARIGLEETIRAIAGSMQAECKA
jgi:UDP-glucose 4-epimerase